MQFPWQIELAGATLPLHVVFETAGIFIGFRYFLYLRKNQPDNINTSNRIWILIGAIFGSILGSRLIGGLENPAELVAAENVFYHFYQNKTIVGGLLGGLAGVEVVKTLIGERNSSGDLFTYPIIVAMIIGRIGCFSMGVYEETYGIETTLPSGMNLGDGLMRHPVTLYEVFFLALLWIGIYSMEKRVSLVNGARFKIFMIGYLLFRFLLDFIKPHYTFQFGLSTIQLACMAGLIYYAGFIFHPKKLLALYA